MSDDRLRCVTKGIHLMFAYRSLRTLAISAATVPLLSMVSGQASAQLLPPTGWTLSKSDNGITMFSPCQGGAGAIGYTAMLAWRIDFPSIEEWFASRVGSLANGWTGVHGKVLRRSGIVNQNGIVIETLSLDVGNGARRTVLMLGYASGQVGQLFTVVAEGDIDDDHPAWQTAVDHLQGLVARGYLLDPRVLQRGPQPDPGANTAPVGDVVARLGSSELRYMPNRFTPTPRSFALTSSGRFYEGEPNQYRVQGRWKQIGDGYQLDFADGSQDFVPGNCAEMAGAGSRTDRSAAQPGQIASPSPAPAPAPAPAQRRCRTVTSYEMQTQTVNRCWPGRGCAPETTQVQVPVDRDVCD